ncbi:MAG: BatD family protein [Bacteroidales bacterium]|nr:BatD family protein [Bacteroidales bacterium]
MLKRIAAALSVLLFSISALAQSTIKVDVHNIVGADERFNVVFIVEGEHSPSDFSWAPTDDFQLVWGPQKGSSTSIQMINGKVTRSAQNTYTYILLPKRTGTFTLPAATATVQGNTIHSRSFTVEVVSNSGSARQPSGQQTAPDPGAGGNVAPKPQASSGEDIFLRLSLSRKSMVVGEPVTAVLKLYQRADIAGFEGAKFPNFNGFWSTETEAPTNVQFQREQVGDNIYNSAVLRRYVLIPQKSGNLTIDPAELTCIVNVRTKRARTGSIFDDFFGDDYTQVKRTVKTAPLTVNVQALPSGAPASFTGGVGSFNISASLSKDSLKTHDAASLLVTVSGTGNVTLLEAPKVQFPPDFDVYDVKTTQKTDKAGTSGSKTFEYPFIPRSAGEFTIAPVKFSWYDIKSGRYMTAGTDSLRISVAKGAGGGTSLEGGTTAVAVERSGVKNLGEDIRFIKTGKPSGGSGKLFAGSASYYILLAVFAILAALAWAGLRKAASMRADVTATKSRKASKMALKRLHAAGEFLSKDARSEFYEELHRALLGYVSDKLNMDLADQTRENIHSSLLERGVGETLADDFCSLLEECEEARYSPSGGSELMKAHYERGLNVISSMEPVMKGKPVKGGAAVIAALLMLLPVFNAGAEEISAWDKAVSAYTEGRYEDACTLFENIAADGNLNADLCYNLAGAYFKSGEIGKAVLYYEKALRMKPSDPDIRYNLEFARASTRDEITPVPEFVLRTWMRKISYACTANAWAIISLILFAAALALVLLFLLGRSVVARRAGFYSAIAALLLFAVTLGFSLSLRKDALRTDEAIVLKAVSSVRSSPSEDSAKDLFILHEGTKVRILERVSGYDNISLSDGRQGWILDSDLEII